MTATHTMRAAVYRGREALDVTEVPIPSIGDHDVLVRVAYCGVCGTDLHILFGHGDWGVPGSVYGHEWSGEVVDVGPNVTRWTVGDKVVGAERTCGACEFCLAGRPSLCRDPKLSSGSTSGGFAEYAVRHQDALFPVDSSMDLRAAALAEPLAVALHGVTRSCAETSDRVLVTGGGPIGLLTVAALVGQGFSDVFVSEPLPARRSKAEQLGASALSPADLPEIGHYMQVVSEPFDVAIECSGTVSATSQALDQLRPGGRLVIVGTNFDTVPFHPLRILVQELDIVGARQYDPNGFGNALSMLQHGSIAWRDVVEPSDTALGDVMRLFQEMRRGVVSGKPLVVGA